MLRVVGLGRRGRSRIKSSTHRGVAVGRDSRVAASHGGVRACVSVGQVPLLGRDAVDNAESIMRKVHDARAEFVRRK
jgi:hypothetical protein